MSAIYTQTYDLAGWVISCPDWDEDLPFASVWHTDTREPGTARTGEEAQSIVARDAFGECIYWPTAQAAADALVRPRDEVLAEVLG